MGKMLIIEYQNCWSNQNGIYETAVPEKVYEVVLASFLSGSDELNGPKQQKGVFDKSIISVKKGEKFIYEVVRDYFRLMSPINQQLEGRLILTEVNNMTPTSRSSSASKSIFMILCVLLNILTLI